MERSDKIKKQPSTVQDADGVKHIQLSGKAGKDLQKQLALEKQPPAVTDADGVKHIQLPVEELGKNCDFFTNDDDSNSNGN